MRPTAKSRDDPPVSCREDIESMLVVRYERPEDFSDIRKVHEPAFSTKAEAGLVDALRNKDAHRMGSDQAKCFDSQIWSRI